MPYKSDAQRKFFHTDTARKKGITPEMVNEYDNASKGMNLPEHKERMKKNKHITSIHDGRKN